MGKKGHKPERLADGRLNPRESLESLFSQSIARRRSANGTVWFDSPHILYLVQEQAETYLHLMGEPQYKESLHDPIRMMFADCAPALLVGLGNEVDFFDLGPGYPDKSFPLIDFLLNSGKSVDYVPIDISKRLLDVAVDAVRNRYSIQCRPIHNLFEQLAGMLHGGLIHRESASLLAVLGVTFGNFRPSMILRLLSRLVRRGGVVLIASELSDSHSRNDLIEPYFADSAERLNWLPLSLLDLRRSDFRYDVRFAVRSGRVEMGFVLEREIESGLLSHIDVGSRIVTAISYRYSRNRLEALVRNTFSDINLLVSSDGQHAVIRLEHPLTRRSRGK